MESRERGFPIPTIREKFVAKATDRVSGETFKKTSDRSLKDAEERAKSALLDKRHRK